MLQRPSCMFSAWIAWERSLISELTLESSSLRVGAAAWNWRGFEENEVGSCLLEEDRDYDKEDGDSDEEDGAFREKGKEIVLQNLKRVDWKFGERTWCKRRRMKEERKRLNWKSRVGWNLYRFQRFECSGGRRCSGDSYYASTDGDYSQPWLRFICVPD